MDRIELDRIDKYNYQIHSYKLAGNTDFGKINLLKLLFVKIVIC